MSTVAVDVGGLGAVQPRALAVEDAGIRVQALGHLVADDVDEPFEHSL